MRVIVTYWVMDCACREYQNDFFSAIIDGRVEMV